MSYYALRRSTGGGGISVSVKDNASQWARNIIAYQPVEAALATFADCRPVKHLIGATKDAGAAYRKGRHDTPELLNPCYPAQKMLLTSVENPVISPHIKRRYKVLTRTFMRDKVACAVVPCTAPRYFFQFDVSDLGSEATTGA